MGVLVVGMHRSGTSAVASALEAMGLNAGAPDALMAPDAGNPAGYFELRSISDLDDELLARFGGRWDCPPELVDGWESDPALTPYVRRAAALVVQHLGRDAWVLKDPRVPLVLPFWRRALLDRCAAVLVVRRPMEVAWSLALRNGMSIMTGLALWSAYTRAALRGLSGLPVHVCSYDDLVDDPGATVRAFADSLVRWSELAPDADVEAGVARVQPELRRNTWPRDTADALDVPGEIDRLEKFVLDLRGTHDVFQPARAPAASWEQALLAERRAGVEQVRAVRAELETVQGDLRAATAELASLRDRLAEVTSAHESARHDADALRSAVGELERALAVEQEQSAARAEAVERNREQLALVRARWDRLEARRTVRAFRFLQRLARRP